MKRIALGSLCLFLLTLMASLGYTFLSESFRTIKGYDNPLILVIPKGSSARDIAATLEGSGVIPSAWVFYGASRLTGKAKSLKSGEYEFSRLRSPQSVLEQIASGKILYHRFTLPEGLTSRDIQNLLSQNQVLEGPLPDNIPEGTLLPETYTFERGMTRQKLVLQMQQAAQKALDELWPSKAPSLPFSTKAEAIILASIIEKETRLPEERPHVASVFVNRLRLGMPLQTDPTVIYALEVHGGQPLGRPLIRADLTTPSPYNTYLTKGLPPGPICHPGVASLRAALAPSTTDDLYFVATGTGGHTFSKTYENHTVHHKALNKVRKASKNSY